MSGKRKGLNNALIGELGKHLRISGHFKYFYSVLPGVHMLLQEIAQELGIDEPTPPVTIPAEVGL